MGLFKKLPVLEKEEQVQKFCDMTKTQKKNFLSNDLIERMIRVEQRVSGHFGKFVSYNNTEYYKSLNPCEKVSFEEYLKNRNKKRAVAFIFFLFPIFVLFLLNVNFTGNVINENFGKNNLLDYSMILIILALFVSFLFYFTYKKIKNLRFSKHFNILENIYIKKGY